MSRKTKTALIVLVVVLVLAIAFGFWTSRASAQEIAASNKSAATETPATSSDGGPTG